MKMFFWNNPYKVTYGGSVLFAIAETEEAARKLAAHKCVRYTFGDSEQGRDNMKVIADKLGPPTRIVDLPCAEWHESDTDRRERLNQHNWFLCEWPTIHQALQGETLTIKQLAAKTSLSLGKVIRIVLMAQDKGLVRVHHNVIERYVPREVWQLRTDWVREQNET